MFDQNSIVFFDGEYKLLKDVNVSLTTHALHYGSGVFEGIRAYNTKKGTGIFRLKEHIDRLFYSAKAMKLQLNYSKEELEKACLDVVAKNNLKEAYIRPLVFAGDKTLGIEISKNPTRVFITAWKWGKYLSESVVVEISKFRRISEKSTITDAKISGHYVNSILAHSKATENGYDEALLLDHTGAIAEGPGANIFFIKDKNLYTPKLGKILNGITRQTIIEQANVLGYIVREQDIFPEDLKKFDGAFFTGTAAEVTPISKIILENKEEIIFDIKVGQDIKEKFLAIIKGEDDMSDEYFSYIK